jgi:hypothetical protein
MLLGTSMGDARPNAVVPDEDGLQVAKFNRVGDRWNNARVEHATLRSPANAESRRQKAGSRPSAVRMFCSSSAPLEPSPRRSRPIGLATASPYRCSTT